MLVQRLVSVAETAPNFNVSLQSLINIDKEAREMGVTWVGRVAVVQRWPDRGGAGVLPAVNHHRRLHWHPNHPRQQLVHQ